MRRRRCSNFDPPCELTAVFAFSSWSIELTDRSLSPANWRPG